MFRHRSSCIEKIVHSLTLIQPRSFFIQRRTLRISLPTSKSFRFHRYRMYSSFIRNHVLIQLHIITIGISPIQISLSVVIDKDSRIDISVFSLHKRSFQRVIERSIRTVGHSHSDSSLPLQIRHRYIHIKFPVAFHTLSRPGISSCPLKCFK